MPELPEVETVTRELRRALCGKTIRRVCVYNRLVVRQPSLKQFCRHLRHATITKVFRRGKLLICELGKRGFLTVHLKMTGQLIYPSDGEGSRVGFFFSDGTLLDFKDQRLFGELRFVSSWESLPFIRRLGPEPFHISSAEFSGKLRGKKTRIKPLLMDQTFLAGIGNLYAAEILFRAGIDPRRAASSLTPAESKKLFRILKDVLKQAISQGGSSVDDYVRISGKKGAYSAYHQVYDRQGKPCVFCGQPIQRITLSGRGTYYCGRCQN